ncbi:MAG: hypothetical protein COB81_05155 [Flavobacteriaceae bacterium]|nr:MAG: hypothetical protein COB81_05155 [Flavobacteriaceae bacterium]
MKKIAILILITITSLSCNKTDKKIEYTNNLKNCFSENEIEILNEACTLFESKLNEHYPKESIGIKYKLYLKDISSLNEPIDLMRNSPNDFSVKLRNSSVFDKIWVKYSEIYYEDDSQEVQAITNSSHMENKTDYEPKDFYVINPKGAYFDCLINNQKNEYINEYLIAIRDILDISPNILASGFYESIPDKDYDDKTVRLIIAMNLYYEIQLMIND